MNNDASKQAYWGTRVSAVTDEKVFIRGYGLETLVGDLPFTTAIYLLIAHVSEEMAAGRPIRVVPRDEVRYEVDEGRDYARDRSAAGWRDGWSAPLASVSR